MPPGSAQNWARPSDAESRSCAQHRRGWAAAPARPEVAVRQNLGTLISSRQNSW